MSKLALLTLFSVCFCLLSVGPSLASACDGTLTEPSTLPGAISYTYKSTQKRDIRLHVLEPASRGRDRGAIVFFFGGGWARGSITQFLPQAEAARDHGFVAILADYRVYCRDGSSPFDATADAVEAYQWVRAQHEKLGVEPQRIVLAGASAGGEMAAVAALTAPSDEAPAALLLFNPVLDFGHFAKAFHISQKEARKISPIDLPLDRLPPTIIFQGDRDKVVSVETARRFCADATKASRRCELREYGGVGHGFFNSKFSSSATAVSPMNDTLDRSLKFLAEHKI